VHVNGSFAGAIGSITDKNVAGQASATLKTFACGASCIFLQNPAGVVFGGKLVSH
jgi:hypothetical protein